MNSAMPFLAPASEAKPETAAAQEEIGAIMQIGAAVASIM